jgi:haloalkane dehalogenase
VSDPFRTPDERFSGLDGYDFAPNYIELDGPLAGLRMHYVDEGSGPPILLLHGEPTWAYVYRKMIPSLAAAGRVLVPDYIGFGRSDKVTRREWYTYAAHVDSILQFVERMELTDITLVVQDWGGPIGLRVATEHPHRFARLVILNTGIYRPGPRWPSDAFLTWRDFAERNPDLPVGFIVQGATLTELPDEIIRAYEAPFPTPESKAGAAAFPLIVPLDEEDPGAAEMAEVANALTRWDKPCLVAFSDSDPIFPLRSGERLAGRIPGAEFKPIPGASHFLQEDKGVELARTVGDWLARWSS